MNTVRKENIVLGQSTVLVENWGPWPRSTFHGGEEEFSSCLLVVELMALQHEHHLGHVVGGPGARGHDHHLGHVWVGDEHHSGHLGEGHV